MAATNNSARTWTLAAVIISALLFVAAWFLLISPVLAEASEVNDNTAEQEAKNDVARAEVAALREDFMRIDDYRADLAALQEQITTTQRYADIQRLIAQVAEDNDITVTSLVFGTGTVIDAPAPPEPEEPAVDPAAEEQSDATEDDEEVVVAAPKPLFTGLFSIDISLEIEGRYSDVLAAINQLQTGEQRLILINSVVLSPDDTDAEGGSNADATVAELSGQTFVLADPDDLALREEPVPVVDPSATPEPLPHSEDNPFAP